MGASVSIAILFGLCGMVLAIIANSALASQRRRMDAIVRELWELRNRQTGDRQQATGNVGEPRLPPVAIPVLPAPAPPPPPLHPFTLPPPPVPSPVPSPPPSPPPDLPTSSLEERVALVWFTRIGALVLLLGVGFFLKYAADAGWLGPVARLLLGTLAGTGVLLGAELTRARSRPIFVHVLSGVGLGILYLVAWTSHVLYGLTSGPVAFAAFAAITIAGGILSVRSRAELVLVFSLTGGFLAPILLSSGADNAPGLFAYLIILTSLAFAASVRLGFVATTWYAVAGTVALTLGWFGVYYEPGLHAGGAYATVLSRWPALLGIAAITAEWILVADSARRRAFEPHTPIALLLCALLLAHGGAAALLFDAPPLLAAVTTALAGLGVALLFRIRRELIAVPMAACALALALADRTSGWAAVETLVGTCAALAVYVVALLRGQLTGGRRPDATSLILIGGASAAYAGLSGLLLLTDRPHAFALILLGLTIGQVALSVASARPFVGLLAAIAGFLGLGLVSGQLHGGDWRFVAICTGWAAIHLGAGSWELFVRRVRPDALRLATLSVAALGLPVLALPALADSAHAILLAIDGALLLGLGAALFARNARPAATLLLGLGVALLAIAAAVQFSAPITILLWAAMAAVVVALAAAQEDGTWLAGGIMLFGLAIVGLLPRELTDDGVWRMELLRSPRSAALAGLALALLAAARAAAPTRTSWFPIATTLLTGAGHAMLLTLALTETANAVRDDDRLLMMATLVLGLYAVALVVAGFVARHQLHRYLGLGLFALTLVKLGLVDVWTLRRVHQTVVFLGVGALLVAAGFLYARFGRTLIALLRDGDTESTSTR